MTTETLRTIARLHAAVAWLATAALPAAAWSGRRAQRGAAWIGAAAAALVLAAGGLGLALDDDYRSRVRQRLFLASPSLGWLFERKQHLAFGAIALGVSAAATLAALRRVEARPGSEALARELRRSATTACAAAALLALAASVASAIVAHRTAF